MTGKPQTDLPIGWELVNLRGLAEVNPRLDKSAHTGNPTVSFVPMPAVEVSTGIIDVSQTRRLGEVKKGYTSFREGDVLFAKITPCMENGKMAIVPPLKNCLGFGSTEFHVLRPYREISAQYIYYFVSSEQFRRDAQHNMTGAVGQRRVPTSYLADQSVPVPPSREQRRIVAKIEELFSELDKGIESLKTARGQLKIYRQAVLKHAFEGKLTAQWREENKDKLEKPEQLRTRIEQERSARYDRQLKEWKAAVKTWEESGKPGKKPLKPRKPSELPRLNPGELAKLPPLPEGHTYTYLANLGGLGRGKSKHRPRNAPELFGGPYPFIQTGEVKAASRIIREHSQTYSELGLEQSKLWPEGTLCITIAANIAETAFLGFDGCFPDSVVGFAATKTLALPDYVELFIKSVRTRIEAYAPATAQKNINLTTLENLVVPLCSLQEQRVLVAQLEAVLSVMEEQNGLIDNQLLKADALRQSILKKAFAGQLVAQDPNDDPASVLLDRIKAEKEQASKSLEITKRTRKKRTVA